jgi:hypothetical protein
MGRSPSLVEPPVDGMVVGTASYGGGARATGASEDPLTGRSSAARGAEPITDDPLTGRSSTMVGSAKVANRFGLGLIPIDGVLAERGCRNGGPHWGLPFVF